jgi:glycosyltransferase involved in cell wall biosynthesis
MPALDEEGSVGRVVTEMRATGLVHAVLVADNGSRDATAARAEEAGAQVVREPKRGYGAACLAAIAALPKDCTLVVFVDADGSDDPEDLPRLLAPLLTDQADLVIGSRVLGRIDPGAMTWPQRFGNWLAPTLIRLFWRVRFTDLGPFRAIRRTALARLQMQDQDFGWTVEMQIRAAKLGLRCAEAPVRYRRRLVGVSKISGNLKGVLKAGAKILYIIGREAVRER